MDSPNLTKPEKEVLNLTRDLWNQLVALGWSQSDLDLIMYSIHSIQYLIAWRVAARVDPTEWTQPG